MYRRFGFAEQTEETFVSVEAINKVSEYLIAKTETEEELEALVMSQINEQDARKQAWKMAYRDVPIPMGSISLEARREIQIRRDELAEKYYQEIVSRK